MKRLSGLSIALSASSLLVGALFVVESTSDRVATAPQGPIPPANNLWIGISGGDGGAGFCDDSSDDIFEAVILTGGWASHLDTAGNGSPRYTIFQPYDAVLSVFLNSLGLSIANLNDQPAVVQAFLADHIANGSFAPNELEDPDLTRITMRSGYMASVSNSQDGTGPGSRLLYTNVHISGSLIQAGAQFTNGWLYCIAGVIDSTPQETHEGLNSVDSPSDGTPGGFALTWKSPPSPTSSRHLLFELEFSGVNGLSTPLTSADFENLGTQQNCSMNPIAENGTLPSQRFFLVVTCNGTGTVLPQLKATSVNVPNGSGTVAISIANSRGGAPIDIVNGLVLTIDKAGNGQGNVSSNVSGVNCGPMCVGVFLSRKRIVLTPQPEPGSVFTGWSGACSGMAPCQLTVSSSVTATANFELATKITAHGVGTGGGTVSSTPAGLNCATSSGSACSGTIAPGTKVTLQARANRGSRFLGWMGACTGTGPCTFTTQSPGQIIHVFAIFERS